MAENVSSNVINERPAIAADNQGGIYIATRYLPIGVEPYRVTLYIKHTGDMGFTEVTIHTSS